MKMTLRERTELRGYCTGPIDRVPAAGEVGLDYCAKCSACGKRVRITKRGRFSHHKVRRIDIDYSSIELRMLAQYPEMRDALVAGHDPHAALTQATRPR